MPCLVNRAGALGINVKETTWFETYIVIVPNGLLLFAGDFILSFILDFLSSVSAVQALSSETDD